VVVLVVTAVVVAPSARAVDVVDVSADVMVEGAAVLEHAANSVTRRITLRLTGEPYRGSGGPPRPRSMADG
jgi:hypothetical protein